nr:hypothetical protein [Selenomonadaceae bacterium]
MLGGKFFTKVANFFRTDVSEIIGAFFYGGKLFLLRMTDKIDSVEIDVKGNEPENLAEKISAICKERGWKTSAIGFCMQDDDVVTYQTAVDNIPEKEIAAFVKSWAVMQSGEDAVYSFTKV